MPTNKKSRARKASTSSNSNTPRYSAAASKRAEPAPQREKQSTLKSNSAGKGQVVKSRDQASAIALSSARKASAKAPPQKAPARQTRSTRQSSSSQRQKNA